MVEGALICQHRLLLGEGDHLVSGVIDVNLREFLWDTAGHSGTRNQNCQAGTKYGNSVSMFYKCCFETTLLKTAQVVNKDRTQRMMSKISCPGAVPLLKLVGRVSINRFVSACDFCSHSSHKSPHDS